tara:strand:- start:3926 stop:4891 length:966 start_codon:yes stop_codon:yes gene_type:complete
MNNYSWIQQKLHKLALSSQIMREAAYDIESLTISHHDILGENVFVSGLARSGTTILLNAIYESNEFASLSYADMPFILAPNIWSKINLNRRTELSERAHGDGILVNTESPEAFEEVFWKTFSDSDLETKIKFKKYVDLIKFKNNKNRYLSKNNQNIKRLNLISDIFPQSIILVPFRDPLQHINSLISQHNKFLEDSKKDNFISDYMKWIGHTEFGPHYMSLSPDKLTYPDTTTANHWLEQWYLTYKKSFDEHKNKKNIYFLSYENLCESSGTWGNILKIIKIKKQYSFNFKMSQKNISFEFDKRLHNMAMEVYAQLQSKSL